MELKGALKRNGKVIHERYHGRFAMINLQGTLYWYNIITGGTMYPVGYETIIAFDEYWQPYEPEKCEWCKLKEKFIAIYGDKHLDNEITICLLSKHCECGGGG